MSRAQTSSRSNCSSRSISINQRPISEAPRLRRSAVMALDGPGRGGRVVAVAFEFVLRICRVKNDLRANVCCECDNGTSTRQAEREEKRTSKELGQWQADAMQRRREGEGEWRVARLERFVLPRSCCVFCAFSLPRSSPDCPPPCPRRWRNSSEWSTSTSRASHSQKNTNKRNTDSNDKPSAKQTTQQANERSDSGVLHRSADLR